MSDDSWSLQSAIYSLLKTGNTIASGRIYDNVPDAAASATAPDSEFPYVQIGEGQVIPDDTSAADRGVAETIDLHVWSRYAGKKEVKQVMAKIKDALHGVSLTVSGRTSALAWVRTMRDFLDPDGKTRHGVVSIEIVHRS